jgi:flagellar basal body-associated protein FliL
VERWQKIEQLINLILMKIASIFISLVQRLTPKKIAKSVTRTKKSVIEKRVLFKDRLINSGKQSGQWLKGLRRQLRVLYFGAEEKLNAFFGKFKNKKSKELILLVLALFAPFTYKLKNWWVSMRPETMALLLTGSMFSGLTLVGLITSGTQIATGPVEQVERAPAEENQTGKSARPEYYKLTERTHTILNVTLPIYLGSVNDYKQVQIDYTIVTFNRYSRKFIYDHDVLVKDRLLTELEAIDPSFTFEDEGKRVLGDRIKIILNDLLLDYHVKGTIEDVYVHTMLAL